LAGTPDRCPLPNPTLQVKREREVFASLIDAKQRLVLPQQWEQPSQALALAATGECCLACAPWQPGLRTHNRLAAGPHSPAFLLPALFAPVCVAPQHYPALCVA
jgi:hypothetical protein